MSREFCPLRCGEDHKHHWASGSLSKADGCYICQPDNPDAAEEGCGECDREYWACVLEQVRR